MTPVCTRRRRREQGFSLLEVMVSLAILAMALVVLSRIVTGNVIAANHARMTTAATFLARSRISMMEQSLLEYGFGELDGEDEGTFAEEGFPKFRWYSYVEPIELRAGGRERRKPEDPVEQPHGDAVGFHGRVHVDAHGADSTRPARVGA